MTARSISSRGWEGSEGATWPNRVMLRREARKFLVSPCLVPTSLGIQEACQRQSLCCTRLGDGPRQGLLRALARQSRGTPPSSQHHVIRVPRLRQKASAKFVDNPCRQEGVFCRDSASHPDSRWTFSLGTALARFRLSANHVRRVSGCEAAARAVVRLPPPFCLLYGPVSRKGP